MKKIIPAFLALSILVMACNNESTSSKEDHSSMNPEKETSIQDSAASTKEIKTVAATFTQVDPVIATFMKELVQNYLAIKNALINGNAATAANSSLKMNETMKKLDQSLLTADQEKMYNEIEVGLKEQAVQIGNNGSNIDLQREHFSLISKNVYDLVKAFGAGTTLYHDHCPMYNDNKGAIWLSETKNIRNPYYGDKMMTCGSVEEIFK